MIQNLWTRSVLALSQAREREEGQTLVEYALIIALVSVALIAALGLLTDSISGVFSDIQSALDSAI
jgi:pilus assembly protein Flp/PilA